MKNAMKKLTSLLLVAVLLVGAIPFGASAAEGDIACISVYGVGLIENVENVSTISYDEIVTRSGVDTAANDITVKYHHANQEQTDLAAGGSIQIEGNGVVYIWVVAEPKATEAPTTETTEAPTTETTEAPTTETTEAPTTETTEAPTTETTEAPTTAPTEAPATEPAPAVYEVTFKNADGKVIYAVETTGKLAAQDVNNATNAVSNRAGYTFNGWKLNGSGSVIGADTIVSAITITADTAFTPDYTKVVEADKDVVVSTKNQNDIFLNIFVNKDFNNCKTIKLNDHWVIADDKITTNEILQYVVTDYYQASNANLGLQGDGLYYTVGSFMYNWLTNGNKVSEIDDISAKRAEGTVTINIMVTNAVAKGTTAAADTSNPKTGDSIYGAVAVMGISAASLAAVLYVYNKKRLAM